MAVKEEFEHNYIIIDSWTELEKYVNTKGKQWGWELRDSVVYGPLHPLRPAKIQMYRQAGVPDAELPPLYKELWATVSCFSDAVGRPLWKKDTPIFIGGAGIAFLFNGRPEDSEYRNKFMIYINDEY